MTTSPLPSSSRGPTCPDPHGVHRWGLTADEVVERVAAGQVNAADDRPSRTIGDIVRANVLTRFNAILAVLNAAVLSTGRWIDATFGLVFFSNTIIGVTQEVRAKRKLDRLAILHAPSSRVLRSGVEEEFPIEGIVVDDVLVLRSGDQIPTDALVLRSDELEVDESLLTGESGAVSRAAGDRLLSGSFVVAGRAWAQVTAVGSDAYARRVTADARRFTLTTSEVRASIDRLLRAISWVLALVAPFLVWNQWRTNDDWRTAVAGAVAALAGMVPEGLVLLTSLTMVVAAAALARRQVLVQELAAVEGLARVDVVCLDKTGTLTDGQMRLEGVEVAEDGDDEAVQALAALAVLPDANATMKAVAAGLGSPPGWTVVHATPFSSARKWSAATFDGHGTWVVGAPDIVGAGLTHDLVDRAEAASVGGRVLLVARAPQPVVDGALPGGLVPAALCVLTERVRSDAGRILRYFADQGVTVKVISGDHPRAVTAVAERAGLSSALAVDARHLPEVSGVGRDPLSGGGGHDELAELAETHDVFGRVTPEQKRQLVRALQRRGHTVAMTGDGVNDALALKEADIGVAMGSGSAATRGVAQLVLLDDSFARLPHVVGEGRRVIHNVERVANLYLTKNVYSFVMTVVVILAGVSYPFLPRQLTVISALTYGIPSLFLALAPHRGRYEEGFLPRVLRFAVPSGFVMAVAILVAGTVVALGGAPVEVTRAASVIAALVAGLGLLCLAARPLRPWKLALVGAMAAVAVGILALPAARRVLELELEPVAVMTGSVSGGTGAVLAAVANWYLSGRHDHCGR
jgi:cation-transporting P-type ATPase E